MRFVFVILCSLSTTIFANIIVPLAKKQQEPCVYIGTINTDSKTIETIPYQEPLACALTLGGKAFIIDPLKAWDHKLSSNTPFEREYWYTKGISYVIKPYIKKQTLYCTIFDVFLGTVQELNPLSLTQDTLTNRKLLRSLSDALHITLFKHESIASKRIYFSYEKEKEEIYSTDLQGDTVTRHTNDQNSALSPFKIDGELYYVTYQYGPAKIVKHTSKGPEKLITLSGNQFLPSFCPLVKKIAFIADTAGTCDLYLSSLGTNSKPRQLYSLSKTLQSSPSFHPSGSKLVFVSDRSKTPRLYVMDLITALKTKKRPAIKCLTPKQHQCTCPDWSSDGKKIVYSALTDGVRQLWVYDFNQESSYQLTTGSTHKENPRFASNNFHIIYNTKHDLYVINLQQKKPVQIPLPQGKKHFPSWSN